MSCVIIKKFNTFVLNDRNRSQQNLRTAHDARELRCCLIFRLKIVANYFRAILRENRGV